MSKSSVIAETNHRTSLITVFINHALVIALPLNLLYTVRLAPKQKIGLAAVFSLGAIIILTAVARAVQVSRKAFGDGVLLALWGIIESTVCECRHPLETSRNRLASILCADTVDADRWSCISCASRMPSTIQVALQGSWIFPALQIPDPRKRNVFNLGC